MKIAVTLKDDTVFGGEIGEFEMAMAEFKKGGDSALVLSNPVALNEVFGSGLHRFFCKFVESKGEDLPIPAKAIKAIIPFDEWQILQSVEAMVPQ